MIGMRRTMRLAAVAIGLAGIVGLGAGCEDAAKRPVQARVPATVPGPQTGKAATSAPGPLPLPPLPLAAASHPLLLLDRKSTPLNSRHSSISYALFYFK